MSKTLHLIRHSYAEDPHSKPDKDRSLTAEGLNTIRALGRFLIKSSFNPAIILCSPAVRTQETALNLVEELEINERNIEFRDSIYNASVRELLQELNGTKKELNEIALIGHNPSITYFAEYLTGDTIGNMEPSGLVTIAFENQNWIEITQDSGNLISSFHPKHLNV